MLKGKKLLATFVCALAIVCSVSTAAFATIEYPPDGGEWNHGMQLLNLWSDYIHPTLKHYSSVTGLKFVRTEVKDPYEWAKASTIPNPWGGNKANYNVVY